MVTLSEEEFGEILGALENALTSCHLRAQSMGDIEYGYFYDGPSCEDLEAHARTVLINWS